MTWEKQSNIGGRLMFFGWVWFAGIAIPTIIASAFARSGSRMDIRIIETFMPFAMLGLVPFFIGAVIAMHAQFRD